MARVILGGVSPRSLGDLLKGYGVMAIMGEDCPDALFWWDDAFHLASDEKESSGEEKAKSLYDGPLVEVTYEPKPKQEKKGSSKAQQPDANAVQAGEEQG
jgi:hypothetical protein